MRGLLAALLAAAFIFTNTAEADEASPPATTLPTMAHGIGNKCATQYYPKVSQTLNHQGSVTIKASIDETGKVTKAEVTQSSGFDDLDQAGVQCVQQTFHFIPATENGKPVASAKEYRIIYKLTDGNVRPWLKMDTSGSCDSIFASAKARWPSYRAATLQFRVLSTGAIELPFVATSSGDELFDAKAVQCMSKLSYTPAQISGAITEISWTAAVLWSPHSGLAFADGRDMGPYCPDSEFPASAWKGDPLGPTEISYQTMFGIIGGNFAIERESGNPELDQAALNCIKMIAPPMPAGAQANPGLPAAGSAPMIYGKLVRFTWREGHAFVLMVRGN